MAAPAETVRPRASTRRWAATVRPRLSAPAWGSVLIAASFIAATCWWLSRDTSIPVWDSGLHISTAIDTYEAIGSGLPLKALTGTTPYPPFAFLIGALGILFGGVGIAPPIIALNLVFVPLLALGCYNVGRLAFGPLAGMLAVAFALGTPLVIEELHEFMLDAPEAAMVAASLWAILASERFLRIGICAVAGFAVGLGMLTKETFVMFVAGAALTTAIRGGRGAWRGIAVFAAIAVAVALPWYAYELSTIHQLAVEAFGSAGQNGVIAAGVAPPRLSAANLEWYFWSFLNWQLLVPLFAFAAAGLLWTAAGFALRKPVSRLAPELAVGALVAWAALTETYVHDPRYSLPLTVYLAVFGAGWIPRLPRPLLAGAAATLVLVALANWLGLGFGVGPPEASAPTNNVFEQQPGRLAYYSTFGLWVGPPRRDGDLPALLRALRREGVREVRWYSAGENELEFSFPGVEVLARVAGLRVASSQTNPATASSEYAFVTHGPSQPGFPRPCTTLQDGAGVWFRLGGSKGTAGWRHCP
jgi:hypothetical protein